MKSLKKTSRWTKFKAATYFYAMGHVLNPLWLPRPRRRWNRYHAIYVKNQFWLKKYIDYVKNMKLEPAPADDKKDNRIFSIWFQGEENAPQLIKTCFARLREIYGDRFIVLDDSNLWDWIQLPDYIHEKYRKGQIIPAHFADLCRIELLLQHGGMWFDATDFLTHRVPQWVEEADFFMYGTGKYINPFTFVQVCFIRASKGNPLLKAWRDLNHYYWKHEEEPFDYFTTSFLFRFLVEHNEEARALFEKTPQVEQDPTHMLWHFGHSVFGVRDEPFTQELYDDNVKGAFFQKTAYKSPSARNPIPGTIADYVVNNRPEVKVKSAVEA